MRRGSVFGLRGIAVLVMAFGLMLTALSPASAQEPGGPGVICVLENVLAAPDSAGDLNGVASVQEIRDFVADQGASTPELEDLLDRAENEGITGFQYRGCTPETPEPTTAPQTPDATTPAATTTPVTPDATTPAATTTPETPGATTTPDATTPAATTTPETPGATTTPVTPDATTAPDNGDDDDDNGNGAGDDDAVTDLPETGQGPASDDSSELVLLLGAASAMMLAGGFAWQRRRIA